MMEASTAVFPMETVLTQFKAIWSTKFDEVIVHQFMNETRTT